MKHLTRTALVLLCVLCLAALTAGCGASPDEEPAGLSVRAGNQRGNHHFPYSFRNHGAYHSSDGA